MVASRKPSLKATHPDLASEWHTGNDRRADEVTSGSHYRATWRCPKDGYVWEAQVCNRALQGNGCPLCSNKVVVAGINDLASRFPDVAAQWHPDNDKSPTEVSPGAGYLAKWVCRDGHEWTTSVCNRTGPSCHNGCPVCTGKAVAAGVNDLASTHPALAEEWSPANKLKPTDVSAGSSKIVEWKCRNGHTWKTPVQSRTRQGTGCGKCSGRHVDEGSNDLATLHPSIAAEWGKGNSHPPSRYRPGSSHVAEWECVHGHVWKTAIANRVKQMTGCPVCSNKQVVTGFNDLAALRPDLAAEWSPSNTKLPSEVSLGSMYRATWKCSRGHTWHALVSSRVRGTGCPFCSGRVPVVGITDVATTHPHLVKEWAASNPFTLQTVSAGSDARGEWVCEKGHIWTTQVKHRTLGGQGCPPCARSTFSSKGEKELAEFVTNLLPGREVLTTYRGVPTAGEVDIYVPSLKLAFEYNGVYYHSDALGRDKHSHYNKFRACEAAGVQLIVVWEDDWRDRRAVVEKMVSAKLGLAPKSLSGARSLVVDHDVPFAEVEGLLANEHIQGPYRGSTHLGLRDPVDGSLVSVMVGATRKREMVIARFASRESVTGGFARLLSVMRKEAARRGCSRLITYSDNSVSNGEMYARNGFYKAADILPKYGVVWRMTRYHSSSFKRSRFRREPTLSYVDGARLVDLYAANGMYRVWDYGKVRWELPV